MRRGWIGLALLGLLAGAVAEATTIRRLALPEVVRHSSEVIVGTVTAMRAAPDGPPRNLIYTEVVFDRLETLKGRVAGRTATYRFAGGTIGDRTLEVVGVPTFQVGRRYVLLANASLDWLCPAVGWWQGRYGVGAEADTGEEILLDSDGRPVYGFADGRPVTAPRAEDDRPMRIAAFLDLLRGIVREQEETARREAERTEGGPR